MYRRSESRELLAQLRQSISVTASNINRTIDRSRDSTAEHIRMAETNLRYSLKSKILKS